MDDEKIEPKIFHKKLVNLGEYLPDYCLPVVGYVLPLIALAAYSLLGGWLFSILESPAPMSPSPNLHNLTFSEISNGEASSDVVEKDDSKFAGDFYRIAYEALIRNLSQYLNDSRKTARKYGTVKSFWRQMSTDSHSPGGKAIHQLTTTAWRAYMNKWTETEQFIKVLLDSSLNSPQSSASLSQSIASVQLSLAITTTHSEPYSLPYVDATTPQSTVWDIWNSTLFATTLYTTIGYGNIAPRTTLGRVSAVLYSMLGIPLLLVILRMNGTALFNCLLFIKEIFSTKKHLHYRSLSMNPRSSIFNGNGFVNDEESQDLPSYSSLLVLIFWMSLCAGLFLLWEDDWDYFTSWYFFFITMTTIGLGDVVPKYPQYTLLAFVFVLIGLSAFSMSFNIIQMKVELIFNSLMKNIDAEYRDQQCGKKVKITCGADEPGLEAKGAVAAIAAGGMGVLRLYERKPLRERLIFRFLMDKHRKKMLANYYVKKASTNNASTQTKSKHFASVNVQCSLDEPYLMIDRLRRRTYIYNVTDSD